MIVLADGLAVGEFMQLGLDQRWSQRSGVPGIRR